MAGRTEEVEHQPRYREYWAPPTSRLRVDRSATGAISINVDGRQVVGPLQGFGPLWQKTFSVRLSGANVSPEEVIKTWKDEFPEFWTRGNRFYPSLPASPPARSP